MAEIGIVQSSFHPNGRGAPFYAAIVDDPDSGDTKLIIAFDDEDYVAVLSLDTLVEDEDVAYEKHRGRAEQFEGLYEVFWESSDDD